MSEHHAAYEQAVAELGPRMMTVLDEMLASPDPSSGRVAFCAPGNEMLVALACSLYGAPIVAVRAHPGLTGDESFIADFDALRPPT